MATQSNIKVNNSMHYPATLSQHLKTQSPVDLSLMALGNLITNILRENVQTEAQRHALADAFSNALKIL
ncbi:Uncharacterized protein conserved in bacteria [Actinobacillus equuli]|nr:Uncharacterized protein conserved in bacteria [Actinobacillus equuli]